MINSRSHSTEADETQGDLGHTDLNDDLEFHNSSTHFRAAHH